MPENKEPVQESLLRDYMANERTFLAWIRTSIGIMAFGFVVEKFSLFVRQISFLLAKANFPEATQLPAQLPGHSSIFGILLVGLGALLGFLAFIKYKRVEGQIRTGKYRSSLILEIMLTLSVLAIGISLIIYLIYSLK
jgi:putative membrane protein